MIDINLFYLYIFATTLLLLMFIKICFESLIKVLTLKRPGMVFISQREGEDGMLKFVLELPPKSAADVVSRELRFSVGEQLFEVMLGAEDVESAEFVGNDNDSVTGTLVDVDDAGNRSEPREFSFVLVDTLPPAQPGEVGLKVTGEE